MNQLSRIFLMLFALLVVAGAFAPTASAQRYRRHHRHYHHHRHYYRHHR